jgi:hypothetical protein
MGKPTPIGGFLSDVRVIMMIMRILMAMSLCQAALGQVPVLECLLPGARECLWLRPVMPDIKWRCFLRAQLQQLYPVLERPLGVTTGGPGARVRAETGYEDGLQQTGRW